MAIAKWIQFGTANVAAAESAKPQPIPPANSADAKKFGLENFGNTCYANSVLQALYFCIPFRELLLQSVDGRTTQNIPVPQQIPSPLPPPPSTPATSRPKPPRKHSAAGLSSDPPIANGTAQNHYPPIPSSPPTLLSALRSLFLYISKHPEDKGVVAPRVFIDKLKEVNELYRSTMHQDAHEFLNYLLNRVSEDVEEEKRQQRGITPPVEDLSNSIVTLVSRPAFTATAVISNLGTAPQDVTLVHMLFEGILTSETRCLTCETVSARDESFLDLSIDIEQNSSVTACLRQFSASEMLCQKNKFFCDSCCDLQEAEKRMKIKKLPNILALHLKRFKYQEDVQRYIKLTYRVAFPFELRLFNTVDDAEDADRLYELFAIVVHIGNGPHHGHYISLVKTCGSWLVFDDDVVEALKESDIPRYFGESNAGSAYVLYYQAVDIDMVGLGLRERVPSQVDNKVPQHSASLQSSPLITVPAFPPGLADEGDAFDMSEQLPPAIVTTPPQPSIPGAENHAGKTPVTKPNGSHPDETLQTAPLPTLTVPAAGGTSTIGGLLQSLRRGSTTKSRTSTAESNKSHADSSPKSAAPPPLPSNEDQTKTPSTLPSSAPTPANGKDKLADRKANTWFKRKGARMRPESGSEHTPPSQMAFVDGQTKSMPSFSLPSLVTNRTSLHASREEGSHQSQDSTSTGGTPLLPPIALGLGISLDGARDRYNEYDSPSAGSISSSFASASAMPHPHLDSSTHPYAPPMTPSTSRGPPTPSPIAMHFSRQQNKSVTQLTHRGKKSFDAQEAETVPLPRRPHSTFSDAYSTLPLISPVPPLPPQTSSSSGARESGETKRDYDRPPRMKKPHPAVGDSPGRPMADFQSGETGSIPNPTASSIGNAANGLMRVSRKLSISTPMLGFGRKDKEKDKQKDRDKGSATPFASYVPFSMASKI